MKITLGVGSTNPIKVAGAVAALTEVLRLRGETEVTVTPVAEAVESGVALQPLSDAETRAGARQRARALTTLHPNLDFAVGLEGGVMTDPEDGQLYTTVWVSALRRLPNGEWREGLSAGGRIRVPQKLAAGILAGGEMGPLMDEILSRTNTKHAEGMFGVVTENVVPRQREYGEIAVMAFALCLAEPSALE